MPHQSSIVQKCKKSKGGKFDDSFIEDTKCLLRLVPMFTIVIPFQMVYTQMTTAYLTQAHRNTIVINKKATKKEHSWTRMGETIPPMMLPTLIVA
mmetsp:Transcript_10844/g.9029  ORF Transcript_10844/g.9029 Transcript_10844/m.9029 type:complete len:95 (+) Transcript_10844:120-404(+)